MAPEVNLSLAGQVALVSGGSRGIGAATVRMFAAAGAQVAFNFHRAREQAEKLAAECGGSGENARCAAFQANLDAADAAAPLVGQTIDRFGGLDILVVNHGIWPADDVPVHTMSAEHWRRTMAVNLDSAFGLVKYAVAEMVRQGRGGSIVLVSSTAGQRGEAFHADYAASKGALISMTKGLSTELASHRIRVNCVAPGWVETEMVAPVFADSAERERIFRSIPLGRIGRPEEVAAAILFLCTSHAGFITGEVLNVNGGAVLVG